MEKITIKYLSLFTGIGGFELGIKQAYENNIRCLEQKLDKQNGNITSRSRESTRMVCVGYSEVDKYAVQIYEKHFNHKNYGDITKINVQELPDFDLLVGGFPCQSFSIAGKRKGFDDTRGTLFFDIARILADKKPRYFILENVKGLLSHDGGKTFQTILGVLTDLGYFVEWQVLNSKNFGVPQNRERVFFIGHLGGTARPKVFPLGGTTKENSKKVKRRQFDMSGKGYNSQQDRLYSPDGVMGCLPNANPDNKILLDLPKIRRLTPIECERLQGFPDNWTEGVSDTQRYKTLGNAVTVNVIKEIVKKLLTPTPLDIINR